MEDHGKLAKTIACAMMRGGLAAAVKHTTIFIFKTSQ